MATLSSQQTFELVNHHFNSFDHNIMKLRLDHLDYNQNRTRYLCHSFFLVTANSLVQFFFCIALQFQAHMPMDINFFVHNSKAKVLL